MELGLYLFRVPISPTSFKEGGGQAVYKVFFIQAVDISLLSPPQNAFPAGRLQQENKKKVSLLKNVLIPPFFPFRRGFFPPERPAGTPVG
jgi:hypothetical protein